MSIVRRWYLIPIWQLAALAALSAVIFGYRLGREGLSYTEGHRVIPGWEMLETGDYWTPTLFGAPYVRKPPGLSWLIAAGSAVVGPTEFAARLVGAVSGGAMVLATWWFATRWFGTPWGFFAGLAQLATPQYWRFARSAEIEGLNNAAAQLVVYLVLDLLVARPGGTRAGIVGRSLALTLALIVAALAKGPAFVPCLVGAAAAAAFVQREWRWAASKRLWAPIAAALVVVFVVLAVVAHHVRSASTPAVTQRVFGFDWSTEHLVGMLSLGPAALAGALPGSALIAAPYFLRRRAPGSRSSLVASSLAWTAIFSLAVYALAGLHNPRYAMPATTFLPALVGFAAPAIARAAAYRPRWQRRLFHPVAWTSAALVLWLGLVFVVEPNAGATSGRKVAEEIADRLPDGASVWADSLIEARPETLSYARRAAREQGRSLEVRWQKGAVQAGRLPPVGDYLALRFDDGEVDRYAAALRRGRLRQVHEAVVHRYRFAIFRVEAPTTARAAQGVETR